jgi:hypothetical protein
MKRKRLQSENYDVCRTSLNIFQLESSTTLTTGALTSGASEAGVSVIATITAEDREAVGHSPCAREIIIVG